MNLGDVLDRHEPEASALVDRSKKQLKAAHDLLKAIQTGQLRDIEKLRSAAAERAEEARQAARAVSGIEFDVEAYLRPDGDFFQELAEAAEKEGVRLFVRDATVFCYPVLVKPEPAESSVRIGKAKATAIRPSVLIAQLKRLQQKGAKVNIERLFRKLAKAYPYAAAIQKVPLGGDVLLTNIYNALTIDPEVKREYTPLDFAREIYLLDTGGLEQLDNQRFSLAASTATREFKAKDLIRFVDRDGHEKIYSSIRFVRVSSADQPFSTNPQSLEKSQ